MVLHLLPALPAAWPDGAMTGLRARGGLPADLKWRGGRLVEAVADDHGAIRFPTAAGESYLVRALGAAAAQASHRWTRPPSYTRAMDMQPTSLKAKMADLIRDLPDDGNIEDAMERLLLLYKIEKGIQQADQGRTVSHDEAKDRLRKWLD